jgi:FkbM family methyltransferase
MLIDGNTIVDLLCRYNIAVKGVLHIGAHECEERGFYRDNLKIADEDMIWIDGNEKKVKEMIGKGYQNVYYSVVDETERDVIFNITDNSQASSILTLNHDAGFYQSIHIIEQVQCKTERLGSFFNRVEKDPSRYNFWNLDIQGTEVSVLKGAKELLHHCDAIYTEVNKAYVYKNCGLVTELDELLAQYGFDRVHTLWTDVEWGDALYLKMK